MAKGRSRLGALASAAVLAALLVAGCGGGGEDTGNSSVPPPTETGASETPEEPVTIVIGNLTDLTGPSSAGIGIVDKAFEDVVNHFNGEGLIPGVTLELIAYDSKYEPSRMLPGYEALIRDGAQLIYTPMPGGAQPIREQVNADKNVLFTLSDTVEGLEPPGYVFALGIVPDYEAYTFMSWIAENDWDSEAKGPAKIGGAGWMDAYGPVFLRRAEDYCAAHPDQFEWVGSYLTDFSFSWTSQVQALKDADYVVAPTMMINFVKQYADVGGKGKILMVDPNLAFMDMISEANIWGDLDGGLTLRSSRWWTESGPMINLTKELLYKNHPAAADDIKARGVGYLGVTYAYLAIEAIKETVERVGADAFSCDALYDTLQSFSVTVDGLQRYSFNPTKRDAINYYRMYEVDAERKDLVVAKDEWFPTVREF